MLTSTSGLRYRRSDILFASPGKGYKRVNLVVCY